MSHVAVNTPNTLRIFAARPATLVLLKGELGLFGLFRTLPYPINFQKLWAAINLARSTCAEDHAAPQVPSSPPAYDTTIRVIATTGTRASAAAASTPQRATTSVTARTAAREPVKQTTANQRPPQRLVPDAPATVRPPAPRLGTTAPGRGKAQQPPTPARATAPAVQRQRQPATPQITSGMRAAARYAAAHSGRDAPPAKPPRIPESDAFKRAR